MRVFTLTRSSLIAATTSASLLDAKNAVASQLRTMYPASAARRCSPAGSMASQRSVTLVLEVGVIGLGNIGGNLAQNLVADGHSVTVFDLDAERVKAIDGASAASSVADLASRVEVTLTSLPD